MAHVCQAIGIVLNATQGDLPPKLGEFYHVASRDCYAQPGRVQLLLRSPEEAKRVHDAFHGQTVQVGVDYVAIEVSNDALNAASLTGKGRR